MTSKPRGLTIDAKTFATLTRQLARRGGGVRESGAFLLAATDADGVPAERWIEVTAVMYYDDLDPDCLTGGITFHANGYTALATVCRRDELRVVGDIHTHPRDWVGQSPTDAAHPMSALPGHVALIAPRLAQGWIHATDLGAHVYMGAGRWKSHYGDDVRTVVQIVEGTHFHRCLRRLRHVAHQILRSVAFWRYLWPTR